MSIPVFIPVISTLALIQSSNISSVGSLLDVVWEKYSRLDQVRSSQLSLYALANPVPMEPTETLRKRVMDSARDSHWADTARKDRVPSLWCDPENVHVFVYAYQGVAMEAAENLHEKLWGQNLDEKLKVVSGDGGRTWKYLPKEQLDSLQLDLLGYSERVLLFRDEYSATMESFELKQAMKGGRRGVVVTGQPGIGKSSFLYYLLLQLMSMKTPVALERPHHFFLFTDGGVTMHALDKPYDDHFPKITWALSDSNEKTEQPCDAFLDRSQKGRTWVVQTTPPQEKRWKQWRKQHSAGMFIMRYSSVQEISALGELLGLDSGVIRRIYEQWGPSTRTCLELSHFPSAEHFHETGVKRAAEIFISLAPTTSQENIMTVYHILFSMEPEGLTEESRQISIGHIATDRIKNVILYAAAEAGAQERIKFYLKISKQPGFRTSAGTMFKEFVLSWLHAHSDVYIPCVAAQGTSSSFQIPACGENHTVFFASKNFLKENIRAKTLPLLLLPRSTAFPNASAIVLTDEFIITIQVTISDSHAVDGDGFAIIEDHLPGVTKRLKKWRHVFITDNENTATSLRRQNFSHIPSKVAIYSAVFDVGIPSIARKHVEEFKNKQRR